MPVSARIIGIRGDECQCGRRASIRHCPACGSTRTYARLNRYHKHLNGEIKLVDNEYRCMGCGHLYVDEEREFCSAPPVGQKLAQERLRAIAEAKLQGNYLRPGDERIANSLAKVAEQTGGEGIASPLESATPPLPLTPIVERTPIQQLRWDIRREHADKLLQNKLGKGEHPGEVEAYITARLKELGVNPEAEVK